MSHRLNHRRIHPVGAIPGSLQHPTPAAPSTLSLFAFGPETFIELKPQSLQEVSELHSDLPVRWLNFDGIPDTATLQELERIYGLHSLALEDVLNPSQRAKVESFGATLFIVLPMPLTHGGPFSTEQLALFLNPNFLITIQQYPGGDCLDCIRTRIRHREGRIREKGSAYLAVAIIDAVLDYYFPIANSLGERIDAIEEGIVAKNGTPDMFAIRDAKHELAKMRQAVWPMRDAVSQLMSMESWFDLEHRLFLRNALDHVNRVIDILDSDRMLASDLMELSIAIANARLGEVTKFLTMIATIFIPITFVAGVYGMNFKYMPELEWPIGYYLSLALMLAIALSLTFVFWRRGWFAPSVFVTRRRQRKHP
ncbi:MAG: magnesium/cobalt transporter CorA [Phycisphaerales bacterium]|nr:magnesium/cobalt transporter CorA [Phycisphaerales bacterium]